jgi:hypothetical protein
MVRRCRKAEHGHAPRELFRVLLGISQAPLLLVTSVKLRRERSAAWLSGVLQMPIQDPGHVPILARGRLVVQCHRRNLNGTVRLHARSHARGLKLHGYAMRSAHALPMAAPLASPMSTPCACGLVASIPLVALQNPYLEYPPRSGLAQAQPADIYSPSPHTHPGAA